MRSGRFSSLFWSANPRWVEGRRLITAGFLHSGLWHIGLNMLALWWLGQQLEPLLGRVKFAVVYMTSLVAGSLGVLIASPHDLTVGASGAIFGLLGALVFYGRRTGSSAVHSQAMYYAVTAFIFGLLFPMTDNFTHAGGFVGGWLTARVLDPQKPERINHMLIALGCLLLSVLSIIASVLVALRENG